MILHRGDRVHVVAWVPLGKSAADIRADVHKLFNHYGIEVGSTTEMQSLYPVPMQVFVIRNEPRN